MRKKKVYFVIALSASIISIWGINKSYQKLCEPGYIACLCVLYLSLFFLIRSVIRFTTNERMKDYNINSELKKTVYSECRCHVCGNIVKRENLQYIQRFLSPYVIPACEECRMRYSKNRLLRHFVKEV